MMARLAFAAALALAPMASLAQEVVAAPGAVLRSLDRMSGVYHDLDLKVGQSADLGRLEIRLTDCRYPKDNPAGDAYAYLIISDRHTGGPLFQGWMLASSPALNALDHMRYDVWVMRCSKT
ncbi:MAG: DUF2155 domain-containing protein [Mangrovicoccus sp.]|nr:DUF2155 domain-containing protein [Mangrovicoccus sp.]